MDSGISTNNLIFNKRYFFITENEVVTLTNAKTLSNENKNKFYVGIILSISTIENIEVENIEFCYK